MGARWGAVLRCQGALLVVAVWLTWPVPPVGANDDLFRQLDEAPAGGAACADDLFAMIEERCAPNAAPQRQREERGDAPPSVSGEVEPLQVAAGEPITVTTEQGARPSAWFMPIPRPPGGRRTRGRVVAFHRFADGRARIVVAAPITAGRYWMRAVGAAEQLVEVGPPDARLAVAERLEPCAERVWVRFKGPRLSGDRLIVRRGGEDAVAARNVDPGTPASVSLPAPEDPGRYVVAYNSGVQDLAASTFIVPKVSCPPKAKVAAPRIIDLTRHQPHNPLRPPVAQHRLPGGGPVAAALEPAVTVVGPCAAVPVAWAGPSSDVVPPERFSGPGPFLALAAVVQPSTEFLDAAPALAGLTEVTLYAPPRPGAYEVRLVNPDEDNLIEAVAAIDVEAGSIDACAGRDGAIEARTEALGRWIEANGQRIEE